MTFIIVYHFTYMTSYARYTGEDYGNNKSKDKVMPAQIPELAKQNFPLCMKSMQEVIVIIGGVDVVKLGLDFFLSEST